MRSLRKFAGNMDKSTLQGGNTITNLLVTYKDKDTITWKISDI